MAYLIISHQRPKVGAKKEFKKPFDKELYVKVINSFGLFTWEDETFIRNKIIEEYGEENYSAKTTAYFKFDMEKMKGNMKVVFGRFLIQIFMPRLKCENLLLAYRLANDFDSTLWLDNKIVDSQTLKKLKKKYCP